MGPDLIAKVAEHGILGLLLAVSCFVIYRLDRSREIERKERLEAEKQIREKQEQTAAANLAQVKQLVEACTAAITAQTHVTEGHREDFRELQGTFKEYVDEVRGGDTEIRQALNEIRLQLVPRRGTRD